MIFSHASTTLHLWQLLTRLGDAQILLPAAAMTVLVLFAQAPTRRLAVSWMALIAAAAVITTASKVAFMGWGIGWAAINFTGVSGHSMFAAAIYPMLMVAFLSAPLRGRHGLAVALGGALALLVGVSRVEVGAHSWSEVLAGWAVGGAVSAAALAVCQTSPLRIRPIVPVVLMAWVAVMPFKLHASPTHSLVVRLAMSMSGNETPFTRSDLMRREPLLTP
ncbi:Membrane-associated phospholipid phosphatase [Polaromonas sp. CG9_12]|uniref:phosphatase PAP2 family protein n=1 Tax=Polaromonas sp. CG_9.11 TaxID=2787730 RepID=UPI0004DDCC4B|nr:phosphatase PAP2 family protein [Polaromonas sp. CG_9.11]MBG6075547.1 membrane-associated phospholipid phosphatase [Polaromonas sp. CG_9.11]CDS52713.1 Membrane-associated phospholipid phosphatase [Polaromonas sp. CG9_12]